MSSVLLLGLKRRLLVSQGFPSESFARLLKLYTLCRQLRAVQLRGRPALMKMRILMELRRKPVRERDIVSFARNVPRCDFAAIRGAARRDQRDRSTSLPTTSARSVQLHIQRM